MGCIRFETDYSLPKISFESVTTESWYARHPEAQRQREEAVAAANEATWGSGPGPLLVRREPLGPRVGPDPLFVGFRFLIIPFKPKTGTRFIPRLLWGLDCDGVHPVH